MSWKAEECAWADFEMAEAAGENAAPRSARAGPAESNGKFHIPVKSIQSIAPNTSGRLAKRGVLWYNVRERR